MKAVRIREYGQSSVLHYEDAPLPSVREGDVLVRVHATSVNPFDWKVRAGYLKEYIPLTLPTVVGWDFSGIVEAVSAGVTTHKVGDEVYGLGDVMRDGASAEYIAVNAARATPKPKSLSHAHAAAVPLAALAAWQALFEHADVRAGARVLVHAAAGGVGSFAVQLAKWKGAYVFGTASTRNQELLRSLGVDMPIDYTTTRFEDVARDIDVAVDTVGGDYEERTARILKPGGMLVSIISPTAVPIAEAFGARGKFFGAQSNHSHLSEIGALLDAQTIKPVIDRLLPLKEAGAAHDLVAGGHTRGKVVLQVVA
ncbi:MAG: NADP-dependent oxidoreductase [Chloroflexi bacterium]|nr:NADP-dependent oxidoreductase [Chloroflexota bacterium]